MRHDAASGAGSTCQTARGPVHPLLLRIRARIHEFLKRRTWVIIGVALVAAVVHLRGAAPGELNDEGLAKMLGEAAGAHVLPGRIVWEPSGGFWSDVFYGRRLLFLASPSPRDPKDVHRALVRVTWSGKPIAVRSVRNLTNTPKADDVGLVGNGSRFAFTTVAFDRIQSISVLEPAGIRASDRPQGIWDRVMLAISSWQETGSLAGVGRADITLKVPARRAAVALDGQQLSVSITGSEERLVYDLESRKLTQLGSTPGYEARAQPQIHREKPALFWAVDTVRAEVGPAPIAWLENQVFGARDAVRQLSYRLLSSSSPEAQLKESAQVAPPVLDTSKLGSETWPPAAIPSLWKEPREGEGQWVPIRHPFLRKLEGTEPGSQVPPYFYQTFIRPDPKRPYSEVLLIAMDMRQLELRMQAGFEDPQPTAGPPGDGRLPTDPAIYKRVVATFNGAFKTTHGEYGMMVDRRVLLPPVPGGATVVVDDEGSTGLGSWPRTTDIPKNLVAFRQNLDPLIEDGIPNPTGRYIWGWQLQGQSVMTHRTALCVTPTGHLYYAFGEEVDGPTLGRALKQAGCAYGIHLDMNPGHCGFVFTEVQDLQRGQFTLKLADTAMKVPPDRYARWSAKDFFYVMVRDPKPAAGKDIEWKPDPGTQPAPAWLPGIFHGTARAGTVEVELLAFEADRVDFRVRAGKLDPSPLGAPPKKLELSGDDTGRVLAALGLGHATGSSGYGIAFGQAVSLPLRDTYATLVLPATGAPRLHRPGKLPPLGPDEEAVQLPLLAAAGNATAYASAPGALRERGALCVTEQGRVLVARGTHDSSALVTSTLLKLGCSDVVELDRGSHHPPFIHRAGTETPPVGGYETTTLYALGGTMKTTAYRWKHEQAVPSTKPTGFDMSLETWKEIEKKKRERRAVAENEAAASP